VAGSLVPAASRPLRIAARSAFSSWACSGVPLARSMSSSSSDPRMDW